MEELIRRLEQAARTRERGITLHVPELQLFGGYETLPAGTNYVWDGMRRSATIERPLLVFQYTLAGWGTYESHGLSRRVTPGLAFTAVIPSEHVYWLPGASPGWSFFWILVQHPYIIERIAERQRDHGPLLACASNSPLVRVAADLFEHVCQPKPRDALAQERAMFEFLWEHERVVVGSSAGPSEGERMLAEVREYVLEKLARPIAISDIAARYGMSRSHFSHRFAAATGQPPAQFVLQVRLEAATRQLLETDDTVVVVAAATGFANANHFCKVFRQRFRLSPGAFRRQMRSAA